MQTIVESRFQVMLSNPLLSVMEKTTEFNLIKGKIVKRKLDGRLYIVRPYAEQIATLSNSQLRLILTDDRTDAKRRKIVKSILIKRRALAK